MIILGSKSSRRYELLCEYFHDIKVVAPEIDEKNIFNLSPIDYVSWLSKEKNLAVLKMIDESEKGNLVVTADTIVVYKGTILEKPKDKSENLLFLEVLNGNTHAVYTAVSIYYNGTVESFISSTKVSFYKLEKEQLKWYVDTEDGLDKAGGYGIQGKGKILVKKISGDYYSVMGFPIAEFYHYVINNNWHAALS